MLQIVAAVPLYIGALELFIQFLILMIVRYCVFARINARHLLAWLEIANVYLNQ